MNNATMSPLAASDGVVMEALEAAGSLYERYLSLSQAGALAPSEEAPIASNYAPVDFVVWAG